MIGLYEQYEIKVSSGTVIFDVNSRTLSLYDVNNELVNSLKLKHQGGVILTMICNVHPNVCSRNELQQKVWKSDYVESSAINQAISLLRRTIYKGLEVELIETIPRGGYRLISKSESVVPSEKEVVSSDDKELVENDVAEIKLNNVRGGLFKSATSTKVILCGVIFYAVSVLSMYLFFQLKDEKKVYGENILEYQISIESEKSVYAASLLVSWAIDAGTDKQRRIGIAGFAEKAAAYSIKFEENPGVASLVLKNNLNGTVKVLVLTGDYLRDHESGKGLLYNVFGRFEHEIPKDVLLSEAEYLKSKNVKAQEYLLAQEGKSVTLTASDIQSPILKLLINQ